MHRFIRASSPWTEFAVIVVIGAVLSCGLVLGYAESGNNQESLPSISGLEVKTVVGPLMTEILKLRSQLVRLDSTLERKEAHIRFIEKEIAEVRKRGYQHNFLVRDGEEEEAGDGADSGSLSELLEAELEAMTVKARQLEASVVLATRKSEQDHLYAQALKRRAQLAEQNAADLQSEHQRKSFAYA